MPLLLLLPFLVVIPEGDLLLSLPLLLPLLLLLLLPFWLSSPKGICFCLCCCLLFPSYLRDALIPVKIGNPRHIKHLDAASGYHRSVRPHLASLVEDFRRHPTEIAVVAHRGNRRYATTYGELASLAGRFAAELDRRDIAPGDRVLLWGDNSAEWIAAFFGCLLRGVLAVPLDAAGSPDFAARVLADTTPRLIVGDRALLATLPAHQPPDRLAFEDLASHLPAAHDFTVHPAITRDTPFQIVFTSGTTADPKGIVHTHRNVLASLQPIENEIAALPPLRALVPSPALPPHPSAQPRLRPVHGPLDSRHPRRRAPLHRPARARPHHRTSSAASASPSSSPSPASSQLLRAHLSPASPPSPPSSSPPRPSPSGSAGGASAASTAPSA